jgi:hypothetical protein
MACGSSCSGGRKREPTETTAQPSTRSVVGISGLQGGEEKDTYPFICCPFAVTVATSWILIPEFTLLNSEIYDTMDR